jgi:1-acyl-sn-glycerol-3-phosphate acyltransferase
VRELDERNLWWRLGAPLARLVERAIFRVVVEGAGLVPKTGPAIVVFNHVSVLDGPCLAIETSLRSRRELRFLVAAEIFAHRSAGWVLRRFDQIPIRRGEGDSGALDEAVETVSAGAVASLAPEGGVNPDPSHLLRIRSGVARMALRTGAPVIPVGIWGTQIAWPRAGPSLRRILGRPVLALAYGEPVLVTGRNSSQEAIDELCGRVGTALVAQVERARAMSQRRRIPES